MKIGFFDFNLNFGGAPKGSVDLLYNLSESGYDVVLYDAYGANGKYISYVKRKNIRYRIVFPSLTSKYIGGEFRAKRILNFLKQAPDFFRIIARIRRSVVLDKLDVVLLNNTKSLLFFSVASLGLNVKKVMYHRGWALPGGFDWLSKFLINSFCCALVGHSKATVKNLGMTFPHIKSYYVPNYVDIVPRSKCAQNSDKFTVVLPAARPVYEKGHHTALKALAVLLKKGLDLSLVFPGQIPKGVSNDYIERLQNIIKVEGLHEKVTFVGWCDSLDDLIVAADAVILPSHTEGFPRVVIESMLLKTVVIATPVGGIPEAIIHEKTGLLVEINDEQALASALERVMIEVDLTKKMTDNAFEYAVNHFSKKGQCDGFSMLLTEVMRDGSGSSTS